MTDTGSRFAVLPPCLAVLCGGQGRCMLIPPALLGVPRSEVLAEHAVRMLAAGLLLAQWEVRGVRSIRFEAGRVHAEMLAAEHVDGWPIMSLDAQRLLVASVAMGERYQGWKRAVEVAREAMAEEAAR